MVRVRFYGYVLRLRLGFGLHFTVTVRSGFGIRRVV